jgi:hypothetical protein
MISVQVKTLGGKPVPNVTAMCIGPEAPAVLKGPVLEGGGERLQTDAEGRLRFRLQEQNVFVVIANEMGFGLSPGYDLRRKPTIVVKPWGRIEGVRTNCGRPMANRQLKFRPGWREVGSHDIFYSLKISARTITDSEGRFQFEWVPSMAIVISEARLCPSEIWVSLPTRAEVKPEATTSIQLATQGRTVIGRLNLDAGLPDALDLKKCMGSLNLDPIRPQPPVPPEEIDSIADRTKWWQDWHKTDAGRNWMKSAHAGTIFGFNLDGSFAADLVGPERFYVSCQFDRDGEIVLFEDKATYVIPASDSDTNEPFDIGKITLQIRK